MRWNPTSGWVRAHAAFNTLIVLLLALGMILRWMLGYGGVAVGIGLLVGLGLTFVTNKLLVSLLAGVTALDPWVVVSGVMVLTAIALVACLLPARRATRVKPVEALRSE